MTPTITTPLDAPNGPTAGGRRTGATWVAATGAFLLLAAAAVFVAVRWDDLLPEVKLAVLGGLTGGFLVAGERFRPSLPATGSALFHLGALLVPVNLAAADVRIGIGWERLLLVEGLACAPLYAWLARRSRSTVLAAAASAAVIAAACGVAAVSALPVPLILAVVSVAAIAAPVRVTGGIERHAVLWAATAGLAPVLTYAVRPVVYGRGVAERIGLLEAGGWLAPLVTGALAAAVLTRSARRSDEPALALVAFLSLAVHGPAFWSSAPLPAYADVLAFPSTFLVVELAALAVRSDPFWGRISRVATAGAEIIVVAATAVAAVAVAAAPVYLTFDGWNGRPVLGTACGLLAAGWLAADARRASGGVRAAIVGGGGAWFTTPAIAVCALAGVTLSSVSAPATAVAALACLALWHLGVRAHASIASLVLAPYSVAVVAQIPAAGIAAGAIGAALVAAMTVSDTCAGRGTPHAGVIASLVTLAGGLALGTPELGNPGAAALWVVGCWALAATFDAAQPRLGAAARLGGIAVLALTLTWRPEDALPTSLALVVASAIETWRLRDPRIGYAAAVPLVQAELALGHLAGLGASQIGVGLCLSAVLWAGLALLAGVDDRAPLLVASAATLVTGVAYASLDPATLGPSLMIAGGLSIGAGLAVREDTFLHAGAITATVGVWLSLGEGGVEWLDALAAPVAAHLLATGAVLRTRRLNAMADDSGTTTIGSLGWEVPTARRGRPGSWVAYGPGITLLAGSAMAERLGGASPWHAVVAGAVGVVAVAIGGRRYLAAPLILGTATLVLVTAHESLGAAAGVPTWAWLALGGASLLGAAVAMERTDTSPAEAGRRVVDVLQERFE